MSSQIKINPQMNRVSVNYSDLSHYIYPEAEPNLKIDFREINLDPNKHYIAFICANHEISIEYLERYTKSLRDKLRETGAIRDNVVFIPYQGSLPKTYMGEFSLKEVDLDC